MNDSNSIKVELLKRHDAAIQRVINEARSLRLEIQRKIAGISSPELRMAIFREYCEKQLLDGHMIECIRNRFQGIRERCRCNCNKTVG